MPISHEPVMSCAELNDYLAEVFPEAGIGVPGFMVTSLTAGSVTIEQVTRARHLRPGGTVSGPTLFTLCDVAGYALVLGHVGRQALAVTTSINLNFMRKAEPGGLVCHARMLKLGRQLMVYDAIVHATGEEGAPCAQASGTYAIPPAR